MPAASSRGSEGIVIRMCVMEGIGTFFLVLTVGLVVLEPGAGAMAPIAIGVVLAAMIYATGHISGGHLNPAVTLGVFLRGRATSAELGCYWGSQLGAGLLAALAVGALRPDSLVVAATPAVGAALLAEFLFTFALVFVVLNVATARGTHGNSYFGAAIGITVMAGAYAVGPISGAAFNPAVAVGAVAFGAIALSSLWIYLVATLAGGACAALVFNALDLGEDKPTTAVPAQQAALEGAATPQH
jgi:aquaporin Z